MTLTELEQELRRLPLVDRAKLLSRVQLTDAERDELDDLRDLNDPAVLEALDESREDVRVGRVRPARELLAELRAEKKQRAKRRA